MTKLNFYPMKTEEDVSVKRQAMASRDWPERVIAEAIAADLTKPAIVQLNERWKHEEHNVVVLAGDPGVGKTVAVARWCTGVTNRIGFIRATTFARTSRYDKESTERIYNAAGLCLDDLGSEYADKKESFLVDLDELIDTYYADLRPLLITTNLKPAAFRERYGLRVWDRLHQCANWINVEGGKSLRRAP